MKLIIASDLHGSLAYVETLFTRIAEECPDRIVLLGDLLYHGPRNPLPEGYAPKLVAEKLNGEAERIIAVRGNCDAEVDQMVLDFPCMADYAHVLLDGTTLFFTHGHVFAPSDVSTTHDAKLTLPEGSFFFSGHTHVKVIEERDGIVFVNPGSVSIPKDDCASYCVVDDEAITLHELKTGRVIAAHAR